MSAVGSESSKQTTASYSPGQLIAIAGAKTWMLVALAPMDELVGRCWKILSAGGEIEDVLDLLIANGIRRVPSFGLVHRADDAWRILIRGEITASYNYGGSSVTIDALGATWLDVQPSVSADGDVRIGALVADAEEPVSLVSLPMGSGVTMVRSIRLGLSAPAPEEPVVPEPDVVEPVAVEPVVVEAAEPALIVAEPEPVTPKPAKPEPSKPEPTKREPAEEFGGGEFDDMLMATRSRERLIASRPVIPTEQPATVVAPVADAPEPPRAPEEPELPVSHNTRSWSTRPPVSKGALIDSVPGMPDLPTKTPAGSSEPQINTGPPAQMTVKRSAVRLPASPFAGPTVTAVFCPDGHPNPPHATVCRLCGHEVAATQEPVEIARPVMGLLRFSSGDPISLDKGVLLGREPTPPDVAEPDRPHVLGLAHLAPEVSRNHVEVSIDGWQVYVRDLGSTNGTLVTRPGEETFRLHAQDPQPIDPNTEVHLSDDFSFVYEVGS